MKEKDEEFIIKSLNNIMDVLEKIHVWMVATDKQIKTLEEKITACPKIAPTE